MRGNWQDYYWQDELRSHSAIAELVEHWYADALFSYTKNQVSCALYYFIVLMLRIVIIYVVIVGFNCSEDIFISAFSICIPEQETDKLVHFRTFLLQAFWRYVSTSAVNYMEKHVWPAEWFVVLSVTFNRWRMVVSGTWKYDDPRLNMSHEGAARVWHLQPREVLFPCLTIQYNTIIQYKICKAPCCRGFRGANYVCHMFCRMTNH